MAEQTGGLPLDQYTKTVPPGWKPGLVHYPYRRFTERLRLWYRQTDLPTSSYGPAVAGPLVGRPFNLALALKFKIPDGRELKGDEALAWPGSSEIKDEFSGEILTPASENGLQHLLRVLTQNYGADDQQNISETLDNFFDLRRGRLSLLEYLSEHDYTYDEAENLGGLNMNNVGKSHFLLKHSGLDRTRIDHVLLLVHNDLSKYEQIKTHLMKLAKPSDDFANSWSPRVLPGGEHPVAPGRGEPIVVR